MKHHYLYKIILANMRIGRSTNIFKKKSDALAGIYDSISPNSNSKNASTLSPIESRSVARLETCSGTKFNDQSSLLFKCYQRDLSEKLFVKKIQNNNKELKIK